MACFSGPEIVNDGLVLHLDAANSRSYPGSGTTWSDLSGNGYNGTLVNGVGYSTDQNGKFVFDGVNDYSNIPTITLTNFTIQVWCKITKSNSNTITNFSSNRFYEFLRFDGNTDNGRIILGYRNGEQIAWSGNTGYDVLHQNILQLFTITRDEATTTLYFNDVNKGGQQSFPYDFRFNILFRRADNSAYAGADVYSFLAYNRVISESEIRQNFEATRSRYGI